MDALLSRFGVQALNYAIKSGIVLTSNYAIGQCSRLLKTVDDRNVRVELKRLQRLMSSKIKVCLSFMIGPHPSGPTRVRTLTAEMPSRLYHQRYH
jgi:hypothetical protein